MPDRTSAVPPDDRTHAGAPNRPHGMAHEGRERRRHAIKLIREVTGRLGWKYKAWVLAAMVLSTVYLLPQWFLQFFTANSQRLAEIDAARFLTLLLVFGGAVAACLWISLFLNSVLREWLRLTIRITLRRDAVVALNRIRIDQLDKGHRGEWLTRMTSDLGSCEAFLTESLTGQIRQATMLVGIFILFTFYSGTIALALIPAAILLLWFNVVVQRRMAPTLGKARVIEGDVFQSMIESFEGLRTIRSYGAEEFTLRRINRQLLTLYDTGMRIIRSMASLLGLNEFGSQLLITGILTYVAYQISEDELTATSALVYPFYINMFLGSVKGLANSAYDWNRFFIEGSRLAGLLYDESKQVESPSQVFGELIGQVQSARRLSVENLTVAYGTAPPVIDRLDFSLERGEIVALMGPSGCGKSTFLEAFSGMRQPNHGQFKVELEGGVSKRFAQSPVFLSAFVQQHPYLFVGTVRENIVMSDAAIPDESVWRALEEVGLSDAVRSRGGLDEVLTDRGRNLSIGQQYRLALCRALVSNRPFLLMDEPFAALDVDSVERVIETLYQERDRGAGILLVTHLLPSSLKPTRISELTRRTPIRN